MTKKMTNRKALRQSFETINRIQKEIRNVTDSTDYMACFHHHCDHPVFSVWIPYTSNPSPSTEIHYDKNMKLNIELSSSIRDYEVLTLIESWLDQEIEIKEDK